MRGELECHRQEDKEDSETDQVSPSKTRYLASDKRTTEEVAREVTVGTERVEDNGGCVANQRGKLDSKRVVRQEDEKKSTA
jgi:hypothetical protein